MDVSHDSDAEIQGINVTPLVDVTLVLLIIFMVTAKLIDRQAIPLDLPRAKTASATQTSLNISVESNGQLAVDGASIENDSDLKLRALAALEGNPELRAVISASERVSHGTVMRVLDAVRDAGVVRVAFAATKVEEP